MSVSAKGKHQKLVRRLQCQEQCIEHIPYYLSGLSRAHFSDNLSRNSCIRRGSSTEENLCFKIDWDSLIVGRKFSIFSLFYFVFEDNFPSTSPRGAYISRGDLTEGFLRYRFWRGLYMEGLIFRILQQVGSFFSLKRPIKGPQKTYSRNSNNGHFILSRRAVHTFTLI